MVMVSGQRNVSRRGAVLVEAAIVFPVLLLVTFGAIRYGWFYLKLQQITDAARCGARKASLYNAEPNAVTDIISDLLVGDRIVADISDPNLTVAYFLNGDFTNPAGVSVEEVTGAEPQEKITVYISIPAAAVDILPMGLFRFEPKDWNLWAAMTVSKEGVPELP
jgi:hypothetical protein